MNLAPVLKQRFLDANGLPLAGGLLNTYAAGTSTPQATYSNQAGTPNANPVVLDSQGYADLWLDPTLSYKFVLTDSLSNVLITEDNVSYLFGITAWNTNTVYAAGNIVQDASGYGIFYVSITNANQGNALSSVSNWRALFGNIRTITTATSLTINDEFVRSNSTSGNLTHTLPACSTTPIGKQINIKDVGTGGNTTSVKGSGADTVDGNVTYASVLNEYDSLRVVNTGSTWDVF